jgi:hypothetical protein
LETSTSKSINKKAKFGFPVDALSCTGFQRLLIYLAFFLMLFGVLVSKGFRFIWLSTSKSINRKAK